MHKKGQKQNSSGIELAAPTLTGKKTSAAGGIVFGVLLSLLGVLGAEWCFLSIFSVPLLPQIVLPITAAVTIILAAVYRLGRARHIILLLLVLVYGWVGYRLSPVIVQGFLVVTNRIMTVYASHSDFILPVYKVTAKPETYPQICTIFILYAACFVSMYLCWTISRRQSFGLTFLATVLFPAAGLIFNIVPDFRAVLMLVTCWTVLLFTRIPGGDMPVFLKKHGGYRAISPGAAAKSGLQLLPAILISMALILLAFPQQSYSYSGQAQEIRNDLTDSVSRISWFDGGATLAGSSEHVNLKGADSVSFTGKTMLQIQATEPHSAYLKGFTGSIYTGASWESLPESDYQEIDRELGGLKVQNFSNNFMSMTKNAVNMDLGGYGVHVKNVGANKRLIYAPYNLTTAPKDITGVKYVHDEGIRSNWIFGTGEYTLYANSFDDNPIVSNVPGLISVFYNAMQQENRSAPQSFEQGFNSYIRDYRNSSLRNPNGMKIYYIGQEQKKIPEGFDKARYDFLNAEQAYRFFLYDKYTQLPADVKNKIYDFMQEQGLIAGKRATNIQLSEFGTPVGEMVNAVKTYLSQHYSYSLTPGKVPAGKDFTEYFLFENMKGYCVHFATAAVLMLRAAGVPARYAEGYIVTADDYKNAPDGWANIRDYRAHAWVEVYYPGLGWQPVEMTPGFNVEQNITKDTPETVSSIPASSKPESSVSSEIEKPERNPQSRVSSSSVPSPTSQEDEWSAYKPVAMTAAAILLILAAAAVRRKLGALLRKRRFSQQNRNRAALAVYSYILKLLRYGGKIPDEITELAWKARFSQHTVSPEELANMLDFAERLATNNLFHASYVQKILMLYIYGLA